jgi:hypothetical protein
MQDNNNISSAEIIAVAQKVLAREGKAIADLIGRPLEYTKGISFEVNENDDGVADCNGTHIRLFKKYFGTRAWDVEGAAVHELTHAIQRGSRYEGEFVWMVEGIADFVRHKLGYGIIRSGDPRKSYGHAAGFYNWLYNKPDDNHKTYYAFVKDVTAGIRPAKLDDLLAEYNCGELRSDFSAAAQKDKPANDNTNTVASPTQQRKAPKGPSL